MREASYEVGEPELPLPGRQEALMELETRIPQLQERTRTAVHGIGKIWQPTDFLPNFSEQDRACAEIRAIQRSARNLSPELLVVLVGDTVTEEGLPLFTSRLFTIHGLPSDETGDVHSHPGNLQRWFNQWTAEEHRHGTLLSTYLRLTGRVDMGAFERTVQLFLEDGMDLRAGNDPYTGFVYTSFQELATQRSHANVAKIANTQGDPLLAKICGQIASDEAYHAKAYIAFVRIFFERDPNGMMHALRDMLERGIVMPAHNMREVDPSGKVLRPGETYEYFSNVAQQLGVYTAKDYAKISAQLLEEWNVGRCSGNQWEALPFSGLSADGRDAQQEILRRQQIIQRLAARDRTKAVPPHETSWLVK